MEEQLKKKVADGVAFLAAVFVILANPLGILGAAEIHARAAYRTTRRWGWELRKIVGEHIAWPIVWFYLGAVVIIDMLAFAALAAVPVVTVKATTLPLDAVWNHGHWTRGFVWWSMGLGTAVMLLHVGEIVLARYTHPAKMPLAKGAILFHIWLRVMGLAVVAHAIAVSCELALIPAVGLVVVVLATAYVAALALGWMAQKTIEIIEAGGTAALAPLAPLPILTVADVKKFADFFKNEQWRAAPLKVAVDEATIHATFLLLVSFWPTPAWATIVGVPIYGVGLYGIIAKLNGSAEKVKEQRERFIWRIYQWAPVGLVVARLVAEIPVVKQFWMSMLGLGSTAVGWGTNTMRGKFENPIPSLEVWKVLLFITLATITALVAWKWSSELSKWGKAALRVPAGLFLGLMLLFGLPNATCGALKGCGHDDEEKKEATAEKQKSETSESKHASTPPPKHTAPPRRQQQPVAKPDAAPTRTPTAPAKPPSQMTDAELSAARQAIIAKARR